MASDVTKDTEPGQLGLNPEATLRLRQWRWGRLPTYNGFVHEERVRGWQLVHLLINQGVLPPPTVCSISGSRYQVAYHSEDYYGWDPYPVSRPIHLCLHSRFRDPDSWLRVVDRYARTGEEWFARLSMVPIDLAGERRRQFGEGIENVFVRFPARETSS